MTPTRAATNRANSQNSTGPRTDAGKQRSSLNALRHALTGQTIVLPSDDLIAYQLHCQKFFDEYHPKSETEKYLVQTIADTTWRRYRIAALENNLLTLGIVEHQENVDTGLAMAQSYRDQARVLANLSLHEQRLSRLFEKTLKQLREIQAERRNLEKEQLQNAEGLPSKMASFLQPPICPSETKEYQPILRSLSVPSVPRVPRVPSIPSPQ